MKIDFGHPFSLLGLHLPAEAKKLNMIWIPPGTFIMGSREDEPGYDHLEDEMPFQSTLSKGFWIGQYPVTQAHWQAVMRNNPSYFQSASLDCPVENVSWHDALSFCEQLNQQLARDLPAGYRFSLPTEMQWEYACRAGSQTAYYSGDSEADLARVAWYAENSGQQTHPVGEKEPNGWGLYDTHGNVLEWCYDIPTLYPKTSAVDWMGHGRDRMRAFRGGGWKESYDSGGGRSASRGGGPSDMKRPWIGFRLCLSWLA